ncbi:MAG: hypothetical protein IJV08_03040 [Bacteroidaceae bacterium]|nr:hypothetical protein [Bacteroidaceae bacterium]
MDSDPLILLDEPGEMWAVPFWGSQLIEGEYDAESVCMGLSYLHWAANDGNLCARKCLDKFYELAPDENYTAEADDEEEAFGDFYMCKDGAYEKFATIGDILSDNWEDGRPRVVVGAMQIVSEWMSEGESVKVEIERGGGVVGDLINLKYDNDTRLMTVRASFLTLLFLRSSLQCYCAPSDEWTSATVSLSPDWEKESLILVDTYSCPPKKTFLLL